MEHDWITHRRPTEADGNEDGNVLLRAAPGSGGGACHHWSYVGEGAPWMHAFDWNPPTTTPRKFVAINRTVHAFGQIIDAIDEDGVAWWMVLGTDEGPSVSWTQLTPLPAREVQAGA